jgi:membrane fusion protein, multidrug efflux system
MKGQQMTANRMSGALAVTAAVLALSAGCAKPPEQVDTTRPARVMMVRAAPVEDVMVFAGEVRPRYETDLAFRIGGKVLERNVDPGVRVAKGQPLARLDPQDARLSAAAAAAQVAVADADLAYVTVRADIYGDLQADTVVRQLDSGIYELHAQLPAGYRLESGARSRNRPRAERRSSQACRC